MTMMPTMQLIWNDSIRETWDGFEAEQPRLLEQSWAYGQAMQQQGLSAQVSLTDEAEYAVAFVIVEKI